MKKQKPCIFIILSIVCPIIAGSIIYYVFCPDVLFVQYIDKLIKWNFHFEFAGQRNFIILFIRNYLFDILWAYSLTVAIYAVIGKKTAGIFKTYIIAFVFSALIELIQLLPVSMGTFDFMDIIAEAGAELFAVLILIKLKQKEENV